MLFSFGFDSKMIVWNTSQKGGVVSLKKVENDVKDCAWKLYNQNNKTTYQILTCGNNDLSIYDLDPFKGTLVKKTCNLGKIHRYFSKLEFVPKTNQVMCGTYSGDILVLDLQYFNHTVLKVPQMSMAEKERLFHVREASLSPPMNDVSKVTHLLTVDNIPNAFFESTVFYKYV